jgi:hypothetical protein
VITDAELQLLISGVVSQAGSAIEAANGRRLTVSETDRLASVITTGMQMVADRCHATQAKVPPPPPYRVRHHAQHFQPLKTTEMPRVTDEDIARAKK